MKLAEGAPAGGEVWASPPPTAEETEALPLAEKRLHFSRSAAYARQVLQIWTSLGGQAKGARRTGLCFGCCSPSHMENAPMTPEPGAQACHQHHRPR
jgi:hypothetical protein